ncbi:MAG TPA: hypothetical protein VGC08_02710, partial [Pedobacter sp.]
MNIKKVNALLLMGIAVVISSCSKKDPNGNLLNAPGKSQVNSALASPVGDVVGKITVGYQGWFAATGDGSPINAWWHW